MKGRVDDRKIVPCKIDLEYTGPDLTDNAGYPPVVSSTYEKKSLTRSYPPSVNLPPNGGTQRSRPSPTPKVIWVPSSPPIYRTVRKKVGGRWYVLKKVVKVPKTIFVYPKRKGKKRKKPSKSLFRRPNPLSTMVLECDAGSGNWTGVLTVKQPNDLPDLVYTKRASGDLGLIPIPFGPVRGSGDHRPDVFGIAALQESEMYYRLYEKTIGGFYDDLKDQSINFAQALAELRQTSSMIIEAAGRIANLMLALKKGNINKVAKIVSNQLSKKQISNDWLVYQYGVKPLMSDVDGMAKHLANSIHQLPKVSAKKSSFEEEVFSDLIPFSSGGVAGVAQLSIKTKYAMKIGCDVLFDTPYLTQLKQLGFVNVPNLIYELIPFSFVADWFFPIGDFLNRLDATADLKCQQIYFTSFVTQDITLTLLPGGTDDNGFEWSGSPVTTTWKIRKMVRHTPSTLPPIPDVKLKNPFSLTRIANALALFVQLKR